jgi:hypothetical protein
VSENFLKAIYNQPDSYQFQQQALLIASKKPSLNIVKVIRAFASLRLCVKFIKVSVSLRLCFFAPFA